MHYHGWSDFAPMSKVPAGPHGGPGLHDAWINGQDSVVTQERAALSEYIDRIAHRHGGREFPPGRTPGLEFMAHLWEPLPFLWKPFAVHAAAEAMRAATCAALWALGFRASRCQARSVDIWGHATCRVRSCLGCLWRHLAVHAATQAVWASVCGPPPAPFG